MVQRLYLLEYLPILEICVGHKRRKIPNLGYMFRGSCTLCKILLDIGIAIGITELCYLTMHSTHFIYGYMASDIW